MNSTDKSVWLFIKLQCSAGEEKDDFTLVFAIALVVTTILPGKNFYHHLALTL